MKSLAFLFCLLPLLLLNQCVPYDPGTGPSGGTQYLAGYGPPQDGLPMSGGTPTYQPKGYWDGDGVEGSAMIRIVRAEQKAYFYKRLSSQLIF